MRVIWKLAKQRFKDPISGDLATFWVGGNTGHGTCGPLLMAMSVFWSSPVVGWHICIRNGGRRFVPRPEYDASGPVLTAEGVLSGAGIPEDPHLDQFLRLWEFFEAENGVQHA